MAERVFYIDGRPAVTVRIGRPRPWPRDDGDADSECPYQIEGLGSGRVRRACGVDHIQALWLASQTVGTELYGSQEFKEERLRAHSPDNWSRDLGMPVLENFGDLLPEEVLDPEIIRTRRPE
ncbi:MAG: DUF6968 family protein [Sphingosinicella sp.]